MADICGVCHHPRAEPADRKARHRTFMRLVPLVVLGGPATLPLCEQLMPPFCWSPDDATCAWRLERDAQERAQLEQERAQEAL